MSHTPTYISPLATKDRKVPRFIRPVWRFVLCTLVGWFVGASQPSVGQDKDKVKGTKNEKTPAQATAGSDLVRLSPSDEVWIDPKRKRVIVGGKICLREGTLEMFACPVATKEHESIVAVNAKAYQVHTALLAIGARPGHPVQYEPVYRAASGSPIQVDVIWKNAQGVAEKRNAQQMIRQVRTDKPLDQSWVFAGSGFWEDQETGERLYQAEGGELICVSNFSTAMLDLPVASPHDTEQLLFEALTDQIPPVGTKVRLVLSVASPAGR